jgi:hypothetical protein
MVEIYARQHPWSGRSWKIGPPLADASWSKPLFAECLTPCTLPYSLQHSMSYGASYLVFFWLLFVSAFSFVHVLALCKCCLRFAFQLYHTHKEPRFWRIRKYFKGGLVLKWWSQKAPSLWGESMTRGIDEGLVSFERW